MTFQTVDQRGFTLVELLVVISIISVMSSIVLVALNGARYKAKDARIMQEAVQLRNVFEQGWNGNSYSDFTATTPGAPASNFVAPNSFSNPNVKALISDILELNGGLYGGGSWGTITACGNQVLPATGLTWNINELAMGMGIMAYPPCGPVKNYAIYVSMAPVGLSVNPLVDTAYATVGYPDPSGFKGYFCVDSSGNTINRSDGWLPGYTGTYPNISINAVQDGKCH